MTEISRSAQLKQLAKELEAAEKEDQKRQKDLQRWSDLATRIDLSLENRSPYHQATAVEATLEAYAELERKSKELGYTSLAVALKAVGQQKKTNLPPLYNVPPLQWVTGARLERVREGLKERVYKVPAVTTKKAQALLKGIRPLLEQLYELWGEDVDYTPVEEAYRTQSYKEFVASLHQVLFEEVAGIEQEEEVVVTEPPKPATQLTEEEQLLGALNSLGSGTDYGLGEME